MVENAVAEKDRDEIGTSKEENQFNFGAGKRQEVDPRWKHPKPFQYEEDGMVVTRTSVWSAPGCHEGCGVLVYSDKETGKCPSSARATRTTRTTAARCAPGAWPSSRWSSTPTASCTR